MMPRIVLGMTLYNNARHLPEAADSLLSQTHTDFMLLMLDDGSSDGTEAIARDYERRDSRIRYLRHDQRQGMVPTWHEVAERAYSSNPAADYFAWVSDHDRWHPEWLARLVGELDTRPDVVLAYPLSPRIDEDGNPGPKEPRTFDTLGVSSVAERWSRFCHDGVGAGDMVYGLVRLPALRAAGIFRPVLRPDRLLIAELTLQGQIHQVQEPLWFRRQSDVSSVARQSVTLFAGATPRLFMLPPWIQHAVVLFREVRPQHGAYPGSADTTGIDGHSLWDDVYLAARQEDRDVASHRPRRRQRALGEEGHQEGVPRVGLLVAGERASNLGVDPPVRAPRRL